MRDEKRRWRSGLGCLNGVCGTAGGRYNGPVHGGRPSGGEHLAMAKEVDVAIGILIENSAQGWRLLITRRPDKAIYGGYWELPGGKLEAGETIAQCLSREFAEEVGLTIAVGRMLPVIAHHYEHGRVRLHPFFCRRTAGEPRNLHVAEHRWVSPEELKNYRFLPANEGLMDVIRQALSSADEASRVL